MNIYNVYFDIINIEEEIKIMKKYFPVHNKYGVCFEVLSNHISNYFLTNFIIKTNENIKIDPLIYYPYGDKINNEYFVRIKGQKELKRFLEEIKKEKIKLRSIPINSYITNKLVLKETKKDKIEFVYIKNKIEKEILEKEWEGKIEINKDNKLIVEIKNLEKYKQLLDWYENGVYFDIHDENKDTNEIIINDQIIKKEKIKIDLKPEKVKKMIYFGSESSNYDIIQYKSQDVIKLSEEFCKGNIEPIKLPKRRLIFDNLLIISEKDYGIEIDDIMEFTKPYNVHNIYFDMINNESVIKLFVSDISSYYGLLHTKMIDRSDFLSVTSANFTNFYKQMKNNMLFNQFYFWVDYNSLIFNVNAFSFENAKSIVEWTLDHVLNKENIETNLLNAFDIKLICEGDFQQYIVVIKCNPKILSAESVMFLNGKFNHVNSIKPFAFWNNSARYFNFIFLKF